MINSFNNISFKGQFQINKSELSKIPTLQKIKFLKQKDKLIADFCPEGDSFIKIANGYKKFGIIANKL